MLLIAAAFLFLYNLEEYAVSDREYREARDHYEGVLTVEEQAVPENNSLFDYFLLSDETNPGNQDGKFSYAQYHQKSLDRETIEALVALPHISRVEQRYLTSGVSPDLVRLDTDTSFFPYYGRCVLTATVKYRFLSGVTERMPADYKPEFESLEYVALEDVEVLAGDPAWLKGYPEQMVFLQIMKEEYRGKIVKDTDQDYTGKRQCMCTFDNHVFAGDAEALQPGRRVLLVLRNSAVTLPVSPTSEYMGVYPDGYFHVFNIGDDSLIDWWPYVTDITDFPEGWLEEEVYADLRELIRVTGDDVHTFDVVYGDDMAAQRRVAEGRVICQEGRFITPADAGQPVCVVSADVLETYGLTIGDTLTLNLGNYLSEQYAPLGAVASTRGRQSTEYNTNTFTIIGTWRDLNEGAHVYRDRYWCWSNNAIFVPSAFLPECRNAEGHEFKPSEVSFVVGNAEEIIPFMEECLPLVEEMGLSYVFSDGGWSNIAADLIQARSLALVKLLIFSGAALFALVLTAWLFIGRKKREYAIFRALGMPEGEASNRLYIPFQLLGGFATVIGAVAARMLSLRQVSAATQGAEAMHPMAEPAMYIFGAVGFLLILALLAWGGILFIRRKSILELLRSDGGSRKQRIRKTEAESPIVFVSDERDVDQELGGSKSRNWSGRYLRRLLGRNVGRSLLSLILAALLAFAFGLLTVLRGIYADLYQNVEVKAIITGGLGYERAVQIAESGYVRDPYYEYVSLDGMIEMEGAEIVLTNRLDRLVSDPVEWLSGWDEQSALGSEEKVIIMYASHAAEFDIQLGDTVRLNETDWWNHVSALGMDPLKPGETAMDRRDKLRPFFQVVGIVQSDAVSRTVFIPAGARRTVLFLVPELRLDIAEFILVDYHRAAEFTEYVKGRLDKSQNAVQFSMDTSYADRIYKIHRLIETLYPLTIAAALLLGGVLPGLTVLHASKELSILRALGVKLRKCVELYTLGQVLCAMVGLLLGVAVVLLIQKPGLYGVARPFSIYLTAHLAVCAAGSGAFAWLSARRHVLAQLQAKE